MDYFDAFGQWWTAREDIDVKEEVDERMTDFFDTMRFDPSDTCVVVTHSLFIRETLARFTSPALEASAPVLSRRMREHKLENCGVLGVDVVFDEAGTPAVVDAKLMFGSDFTGGGK
jgi:broad specificity phosphatase PhoE